MSIEPRISIICPSRNTGHFLQATLDSIFQQDFDDFEIVVADGGSTDETLDILRRNARRDPRLRFISEPDKGQMDAMGKAASLARGKYLIQTCVSDGFLSPVWLRRCCETLDAMPDVSLVWGLPQRMTEAGKLTRISYPQFHEADPPQKDEFFFYWIKSGFLFPEGNYCIRRQVFRSIFSPTVRIVAFGQLLLNYHFLQRGYQPYFLREVANFGRQHSEQLGERQNRDGSKRAALNHYKFLWRSYRDKLVATHRPHVFRDGRGEPTHEAHLPGRRLPALLRTCLRAPLTPNLVESSTLLFERSRHRVKDLFRRD